MTKKHKLKKRVRSRMETEGTSYTEALAAEQATPRAPSEGSIEADALSLLMLEAADAVLARGEAATLEESNKLAASLEELVLKVFARLRSVGDPSKVEAFIDRIVNLTRKLYKTHGAYRPLPRVLDAAAGIDRFWEWEITDLAEERWGLSRSVGNVLKTEGAEPLGQLRSLIEIAVKSGLAAPEPTRSEPRSLVLSDEEAQQLGSLWDVDPDVWSVFGDRPSTYVRIGDFIDPQDAVVVRTIRGPSRLTFEGTDEGIATATADLQSRVTRTHTAWEAVDVERLAQMRVERYTNDRVDRLMRCRTTLDRRRIAETVLSLEDEDMPNLDFVNEVFAKITGEESDDLLRTQLASLIEPRMRKMLRVSASAG